MTALVGLVFLFALSITFPMVAYAAGAKCLKSTNPIWPQAVRFGVFHLAIGATIFVVTVWIIGPRAAPLLVLLAVVLLFGAFRKLAGFSVPRAIAGYLLTFAVLVASNGTFAMAYLQLLGRTFVISASSAAMAPTVVGGDRLLVDYNVKPARWDIVVFRSPLDPELFMVSRLVGLPDERIEIKAGRIYIDGNAEPMPGVIRDLEYIGVSADGASLHGGEGSPVTLGEGECFVLGDNSKEALDSRYWRSQANSAAQLGALPAKNIIGVATFRYGPLDRVGFLR